MTIDHCRDLSVRGDECFALCLKIRHYGITVLKTAKRQFANNRRVAEEAVFLNDCA